jgi:hypothetical protein
MVLLSSDSKPVFRGECGLSLFVVISVSWTDDSLVFGVDALHGVPLKPLVFAFLMIGRNLKALITKFP